MSAPSALTVVYPPSFQNSFWSYPSYRRGAQSLYARLQAGIDEADSILAFVAHRAELEYKHAEALATPAPQPSFAAPLFKQAGGLLSEVIGSPVLGGEPGGPLGGSGGGVGGGGSARGFLSNETGSSHVFRLVQAETTSAQANAHGKIARNLERLILDPFTKWSVHHRERVTSSWAHIDAALARFERQKAEVDKLKQSYEKKCRQADEAEDDARFAPNDDSSHETAQPQRSVSSSSAASLPELPEKDDGDAAAAAATAEPADPERLKRRETLRKQFGFNNRVVSGSSQPPAAKEFAGVKLPTPPSETDGRTAASEEDARPAPAISPSASSEAGNGSLGAGLKRSGTIGAYLHSAVERMPTPLKAAVGGVVSNEPKHIRLRRDADNAERVYEEAVRNLDRTRCQVEEILYEHFGLAQKWEADRIKAVKAVLASYNTALSGGVPALNQSIARCVQLHESLQPDLELRALIRDARTGPFQPAIERFQPYYHDEISLGRSAPGQGQAAGWMTKNGGFGLDLVLVERLDFLDRMEREGVDAIASSTGKLATLPPVLEALLAALERAYADDQRWPSALAAAAASSKATGVGAVGGSEAGTDGLDESSVLLIRSQEKRKTWVYEVPLNVTHRLRDALISQLSPSHADMIYGNRDRANAQGRDDAGDATPASGLISDKMLDAYDPPVLAACVKLWMLELERSLVLDELWDQVDAIYRAAAGQEREALEALARQKAAELQQQQQPDGAAEAGAAKDAGTAEAQDKGKGKGAAASGPLKVDLATEEKIRRGVLEDLGVVLGKLPKLHLACLDAIAKHLHGLLKDTKTDESDLVYLNKVGLALGRAFIRPRAETPYTISARHPTLLVMDLVQHYEAIFPALLEKKLSEHPSAAGNGIAAANGDAPANGISSAVTGGQRKVPIRKRTKPVDQRISRSSIGRDLQEGAKRLAEQFGERGGGAGAGAAAAPKPPVKDETPAVPTKTEPIVEEPHEAFATPSEEIDAAAVEPAVLPPAAPAIDTSNLDVTAEKQADDEAAPTPLAQRVFASGASSDDSPTSAAAAATQRQEEEDEDRPLSNVARLSRQFASGGSLKGSGGGIVRGPRPAGARSARLSGNFSNGSTGSGGASKRESMDLAPATGDDK
ncbi:uncharacterized protein PFL1_04572 [Pseudozyma flocculosa PF-1]|nr:uncharacterized protein PFL1_04572 [Pseudozyma flocculosa PF-1]EPQ27827.1 hypothetical protein PFL1_04572 [Pseudozyma flocculosa PF-1]